MLAPRESGTLKTLRKWPSGIGKRRRCYMLNIICKLQRTTMALCFFVHLISLYLSQSPKSSKCLKCPKFTHVNYKTKCIHQVPFFCQNTSSLHFCTVSSQSFTHFLSLNTLVSVTIPKRTSYNGYRYLYCRQLQGQPWALCLVVYSQII